MVEFRKYNRRRRHTLNNVNSKQKFNVSETLLIMMKLEILMYNDVIQSSTSTKRSCEFIYMDNVLDHGRSHYPQAIEKVK